MNEKTVLDISDSELLARVVGTVIDRRSKGQPAWAAVCNAFCLGSSFSKQLCKRFWYDPETGKKT